MSRRAPNPAAERAAQNQATIKSLLKLEPNKVCADCKRNKHPRWASWNLGVFICIRCSGIHRGMGTHISRVKSVDLDSWTDEQLQSILSWGNARANKYWEAKLAQGHVPSESKIENFIRTKYELKRWAMEGPKPDPSTLDADGDDDVPLSLVKEKQAIERSESVKKSASQSSAPPRATPQPQADLIGGIDSVPPPRSSTAGPQPTNKLPPKAEPAPPKATPSNSSLLGLDFFGEPAAPPRPASTSGVNTPGGQSRPDLKQSILSLYASAPRPQPQQQPASQGSFGSVGGSPQLGHQQQGSMGGFNDAFSSLSMNTTTSPKPAAADPFASLGGGGNRTMQQPSHSSFGSLSGGSFFDAKPAQTTAAPSSHQKKPSNSGFGDFGSFASPALAPSKPAAPASSSMGDLFDLSAPPSAVSPPPAVTSPSATTNSVFNLSAPPAQTSSASAPKAVPAPSASFAAPGISGADVWGSNAWGGAEPASQPAQPKPAPAAPLASSDMGWGTSGGAFANTPIVPGNGGGFNAAAPKVAQDEEFGGWASSTGTSNAQSGKPAGGFGGGDDDLFNNVWQ